MKRPPRKSATRALLTGFASLLVISAVPAQERQPLGPEVVAILGQPETQGGLDADVIAVLGQPEGEKPAESEVGNRAADIAIKLRCPVCQGVSIADSPSGMATNMRAQVRELVTKGYSEEQIMSYFERSYGEFVRLEPPLRGLNVLLWILPGLVLLGGAVFVFWKARQPVIAAAAVENKASASALAAVDPALARFLEKIRRDSGTSS